MTHKPIDEVPTDPNGGGGCAKAWQEVLEMLRKQADELEKISDELKRLKADMEIVRTETQHHGQRLSASDSRCEDRCKMLRTLVGDRNTD